MIVAQFRIKPCSLNHLGFEALPTEDLGPPIHDTHRRTFHIPTQNMLSYHLISSCMLGLCSRLKVLEVLGLLDLVLSSLNIPSGSTVLKK